MLNRNVCVRALAVSSLALSAACDMHAAAPPMGEADLRVRDSEMPEIVVTASRLRPASIVWEALLKPGLRKTERQVPRRMSD
jgi:hypothetical protein